MRNGKLLPDKVNGIRERRRKVFAHSEAQDGCKLFRASQMGHGMRRGRGQKLTVLFCATFHPKQLTKVAFSPEPTCYIVPFYKEGGWGGEKKGGRERERSEGKREGEREREREVR